MEQLCILFWNCRSLYTKLSHFKVRLYAAKPHVVCLTETWLKQNREPTFINYSAYFQHRQNRPGGGLAILVRNDVNCAPNPLNSFPAGSLEIQSMKVFCNCKTISITNVYNPNSPIQVAEYSHYFNQLSGPRVIVGDFNAHHTMWEGQGNCNTAGLNLVESLEDFLDLSLLTPVSLPTYFNAQTGSFSTLDLCFVSTDLVPLSQISLEPEMGSDHETVLLSVNIVPSKAVFKSRQRWLFHKGSWSRWQMSLPEVPPNMPFEEEVEKFSAALFGAAESEFKRSNEQVSPHFSKPWWNEACAKRVAERHAAKNILKRHPSMENLIALRKAEALVKREVKQAKNTSFQEFCSTINKDTPMATIWKKIGKLSNKGHSQRASPIMIGNVPVTDPERKASIIAAEYATIIASPECQHDGAPLILPVTMALIDDAQLPFNGIFSPSELADCIKLLNNSAPGHDFIHNAMLKHLSPQYVQWLLRIFNYSFQNCCIPSIWKEAIVLPILKPGKSALDPKAYRPISLLPCIPKLMERLVCNRLNFQLETTGALSATQCGFRRRLCTLDQVARLEKCVRESFVNRQVCIAVFFDLSCAYDSVWHLGLLYKLQQKGIRGKMLAWIREYLKNRSFKVLFEGAISPVHIIRSGVPQGAILSPTLFNVMLSDLPRVRGVTLAEYADDIAIYCSGPDLGEVQARIQAQVNQIFNWTQFWGFRLNPEKTKGLLFTCKNVNYPHVRIDNVNIEFVRTYKYLGLLLDSPALGWKDHINHLRESCIRRTNVMQAMSAHHWGADREVLLKFYKAVIRSKLDYGSMFYETAANSYLVKLDKIQNRCLRLAIGARKTSPIVSLEVESNTPPLRYHRQLVRLRYLCRLGELPRCSPVYNNLFDVAGLADRPWAGTIFAPHFVFRARDTLADLNLTFVGCEADLLSPIPPWIDFSVHFSPFFARQTVGELSETEAVTIFRDLQSTVYNGYHEVYTDGSRIFDPEPSSTASVVIQEERSVKMYNWKLNPQESILSCELYAIAQAVQMIRDGTVGGSGAVVYTDSLSSLNLLTSRRPTSHLPLVFKIHQMLLGLRTRFLVVVQFIPGHKNIKGNEMADLAAKAAHALPEVSAEAVMCREDKVSEIRMEVMRQWEEDWKQKVAITNTGHHLMQIRDKVGYWPWSSFKGRIMETAFAKFRLGHVGLRKHLYRFNLTNTALCSCGRDESIEHFLLQCPLYANSRTIMQTQLHSIGVPVTMKCMLGGGEYPPKIQSEIMQYVSLFLASTGRLREF